MDMHDHPTPTNVEGALEAGPAAAEANGLRNAAAHPAPVGAPAPTSDTPARTYAGRAAAMRQSDRLHFAHSPSEHGTPHTPFAPPPSRARADAPTPQDPQHNAARAPRFDGWTPERRAFFLRLLAQDGCVSLSARAVGLSHQSAYSLRARDPDFALLWEAALQLARPNLADALWSRAIDGVVEETERERPDGTRIVTRRRRYDNRLAMNLLQHLSRQEPEDPARARALAGAWDEALEAVEAGEEAELVAACGVEAPGHGQEAAPPEPEPIILEDLAAEADGADRMGDYQVVEDAAGHAWTDFPAPPGWTGQTADRGAILPADDWDRDYDEAEDAPRFRTLDAAEQAAWDARRAARAALGDAARALTRREGFQARARWLAGAADLTARMTHTVFVASEQARSAAAAPPPEPENSHRFGGTAPKSDNAGTAS